MRLLIASLFLFLSTLFAAVPTNGLVGWYKFDNSLQDSSGKGHDAVEQRAITYTSGLFNQAAKFGGYDNPGQVKVQNSPDISFVNNFTFVTWFNVQSIEGMDGNGNRSDTGDQVLFAKDIDRRGLTVVISHIGSANPNHFQLLVRNGWCCTSQDRTIYAFDDPQDSTIKLNEWNCLAIKADDTNIYLYLNGALLKSVPLTDFNLNPDTATNDLYIGSFEFSRTWYPFNGLMDNFLIYNRALSDSEIASLCQRPSSVTVPLSPTAKLLLALALLAIGSLFLRRMRVIG